MIHDVRASIKQLQPDPEPGQCSACFNFDEGLDVFAGHFPDDPVLPGVMQIEMVRATVEAFTGNLHRIRSVRNGKFKKKVVPGQDIVVEISITEEDDCTRVKAVLRTGEDIVAKVSLGAVRISSEDTKIDWAPQPMDL